MRIWSSLIAIAVMLLGCEVANAFCFAPKLRVSDEFYTSGVVIEAEAVAQKNEMDPADPEEISGTSYRLKVLRTFRGEAKDYVTYYSENTTARFPLKLRQRYVLFLSKRGGKWEVDNCGNSNLANNQLAKEIQELPLSKSFVYGEIIRYSGKERCPQYTLMITNEKNTWKTKVSEECRFRIDVPPGHYSARIESSEGQLPVYDLPYRNPYCFRVPEGGSAGLAFRSIVKQDSVNTEAQQKRETEMKDLCKVSNKEPYLVFTQD